MTSRLPTRAALLSCADLRSFAGRRDFGRYLGAVARYRHAADDAAFRYRTRPFNGRKPSARFRRRHARRATPPMSLKAFQWNNFSATVEYSRLTGEERPARRF